MQKKKRNINAYLNAARSLYLATRERTKKEDLSRLVTIAITAPNAAQNAANLSTSPPNLCVTFTISLVFFWISRNSSYGRGRRCKKTKSRNINQSKMNIILKCLMGWLAFFNCLHRSCKFHLFFLFFIKQRNNQNLK